MNPSCPDKSVPLHTIEAMLNTVELQYDQPLFGLHMAPQIQAATFAATHQLLRGCSTWADALDALVRDNGLLSQLGRLSVMRTADRVEVRWECLAGSPLLRRHASEYAMGTLVMLARWLAPGMAFPSAVHFTHARPGRPDRVREYFAFFQCPVHFGQAHAAIVVPTALLSMRLPGSELAIHHLLGPAQPETTGLEMGNDGSFTQDVQRLLKALILSGSPNKEAVALQLGTSTRSLHRRLQERGTSYRQLLDAQRAELAREHLLATNAPITDIAERLGFSTPQAFMRWFRQVLGTTPSQYRRQASSTRLRDAG